MKDKLIKIFPLIIAGVIAFIFLGVNKDFFSLLNDIALGFALYLFAMMIEMLKI